ncbi:MAG: hypothetical protein RL701_1623 [Pseudomonadota bacterium]
MLPEHANRLVHAADLARASVKSERAIAGSVVVSASVTLGVLRIVPVLPTLFAAHPALSVDLQLDDRAVDLAAEGVDIAIRANLTLPDTTLVVARQFASYRRVLVASHAYLKKRGVPRDAFALAKHAAITNTVPVGAPLRWDLTEAGSTHSITVQAALRVSTSFGVRAAAYAGLGIAILPDFVVAKELETRELQIVLPKASLTPATAHALYRSELRGVPRVAAVLEHLRRTLPLQ